MNKFLKKLIDSAPVQFVARCVVRAGESKAFAICAGVFGVTALASAQTGTDATVIATNAQVAFGVIAPITITIAGFYVILKIAKKVVH